MEPNLGGVPKESPLNNEDLKGSRLNYRGEQSFSDGQESKTVWISCKDFATAQLMKEKASLRSTDFMATESLRFAGKLAMM